MSDDWKKCKCGAKAIGEQGEGYGLDAVCAEHCCPAMLSMKPGEVRTGIAVYIRRYGDGAQGMADLETYYSIRVVHAPDYDGAIRAVQDGHFDESDPLCDMVLTLDELKRAIEEVQ